MTDSKLQSREGSAPRPVRAADLQRARRHARLTQADLANQIGVRLWTVEQWESGATQIPAEYLPKIVAATGLKTTLEADLDPEQRDAVEQTMLDGSDELAPASRLVDPAELDLPRSLRGYDPPAVEALLGGLAATTERLQADIAASSERVAELEADLDESENRTAALHAGLPDLQKQEALLRDALVTAHRAAHEVREEARQDALQVVRAARKQGKRIVKEAVRESRRIEEHVAQLEREAERTRSELREFLLSLVDRVEGRLESVADSPLLVHTDNRPNLADVIFEHEMSNKERQVIDVDAEPSGAVDSETT